MPLGTRVAGDPRTRLVHGDFFRLALGDDGLDGDGPRTVDAVVVDIDHSPRHLLAPGHAPFYTAEGTARVAAHLSPGGVFALWSNDPPDDEYLAVLRDVLPDAAAEVVTFPNPLQDRTATATVYVATR